MRLYLDTSVLGAELDTELPSRVATTLGLYELLEQGRHRACISPFTEAELAAAPERIRLVIERRLTTFDLEVLQVDDAVLAVADAYLRARAVPAASEADPRHLAVASVHGVDVVVSWNFRHMVNPMRRRAVHAVNMMLGRPLIEIASPAEIVESEAPDE